MAIEFKGNIIVWNYIMKQNKTLQIIMRNLFCLIFFLIVLFFANSKTCPYHASQYYGIIKSSKKWYCGIYF